MKSQSIIRFYLSSFNKPTILQSLRSYKKSAAQEHLHDYVRSEKELQKVRKQKIDYEFITKQSAGVMYFREYAFQQKTEQTLVQHLNCELAPSGAWTYDQVRKQLGEMDNLTKTESQNIEIMEECQSDIENSIKQYYTNIGKKNYQFNLQEEINKINQMTEEEYRHFANVLHNKEAVREENEPIRVKTLNRPIRTGRFQKREYKQ